MPSVAQRLTAIQQRIQAVDAKGRVTLVAVTKGVAIEAIREAYASGHRHFGESRLQEAQPKIEALPEDICWHFIGKLQSNKAKRVAQLFSVIHTLESEGQLKEIAKAGRKVDGLIEINIAEESQKTGILPGSLDSFAKTVLQCEGINLRGLMTIGPAHQNAELMRPYFCQLKQMAERLGEDAWLSMGMSEDFEVAIQEGASHIRVGSAIFGHRR